MNKEHIANLLDDTRAKLQSVYDKLRPLTEEHYDLKLHDIAFNAEHDDFEKYFERFCIDEYELFQDTKNEFEVETLQIGRTSAFTFTTKFLKGINTPTFDYFIDSLTMEVVANPYFIYDLGSDTTDQLLTYIEKAINEDILDEDSVIDEIDQLVEIIPQVEESINQLSSVIDYLTEVKRTQVENWTEYVQQMKEYDEYGEE